MKRNKCGLPFGLVLVIFFALSCAQDKDDSPPPSKEPLGESQTPASKPQTILYEEMFPFLKKGRFIFAPITYHYPEDPDPMGEWDGIYEASSWSPERGNLIEIVSEKNEGEKKDRFETVSIETRIYGITAEAIKDDFPDQKDYFLGGHGFHLVPTEGNPSQATSKITLPTVELDLVVQFSTPSLIKLKIKESSKESFVESNYRKVSEDEGARLRFFKRNRQEIQQKWYFSETGHQPIIANKRPALSDCNYKKGEPKQNEKQLKHEIEKGSLGCVELLLAEGVRLSHPLELLHVALESYFYEKALQIVKYHKIDIKGEDAAHWIPKIIVALAEARPSGEWKGRHMDYVFPEGSGAIPFLEWLFHRDLPLSEEFLYHNRYDQTSYLQRLMVTSFPAISFPLFGNESFKEQARKHDTFALHLLRGITNAMDKLDNDPLTTKPYVEMARRVFRILREEDEKTKSIVNNPFLLSKIVREGNLGLWRVLTDWTLLGDMAFDPKSSPHSPSLIGHAEDRLEKVQSKDYQKRYRTKKRRNILKSQILSARRIYGHLMRAQDREDEIEIPSPPEE